MRERECVSVSVHALTCMCIPTDMHGHHVILCVYASTNVCRMHMCVVTSHGTLMMSNNSWEFYGLVEQAILGGWSSSCQTSFLVFSHIARLDNYIGTPITFS